MLKGSSAKSCAIACPVKVVVGWQLVTIVRMCVCGVGLCGCVVLMVRGVVQCVVMWSNLRRILFRWRMRIFLCWCVCFALSVLVCVVARLYWRMVCWRCFGVGCNSVMFVRRACRWRWPWRGCCGIRVGDGGVDFAFLCVCVRMCVMRGEYVQVVSPGSADALLTSCYS
jgi:hypothetical protein